MGKETELKPKGILFKMDWDEMIMDLEDASVGKMIKNSYNFLNDRELIEMDKIETMLFKHTIRPVLEYNAEKYQMQVEHNRRVATKGGRKPKSEEAQTNPLGLIETQNNPSGSFTNPENPKDKDRVKDKGIDKEKDKSRTREDINKMKKLVELDLKKIKDAVEYNFIIKVIELVKRLSWARFDLLIFNTRNEDVENLLIQFNEPGCLPGIMDVKERYPYFLNSLIK
jgi:hypothetical protein